MNTKWDNILVIYQESNCVSVFSNFFSGRQILKQSMNTGIGIHSLSIKCRYIILIKINVQIVLEGTGSDSCLPGSHTKYGLFLYYRERLKKHFGGIFRKVVNPPNSDFRDENSVKSITYYVCSWDLFTSIRNQVSSDKH